MLKLPTPFFFLFVHIVSFGEPHTLTIMFGTIYISGSAKAVIDNLKLSKERSESIMGEILKRTEAQLNLTKQQAEFNLKLKIAASLADGQEVSSDFRVHVEYSKEFSFDSGIEISGPTAVTVNGADHVHYSVAAPVADMQLDIVKTLKAALSKRPSEHPPPPVAGPSPAKTPAEVIIDKDLIRMLVTCVMAAAKSSSAVSSGLNFTKTCLAPGIFAFLYAFSTIITDVGTFGSESITLSCVMCAYYESLDSRDHDVPVRDSGPPGTVTMDHSVQMLVAQNYFAVLQLAKKLEINNARDRASGLAAAHGNVQKKLTAIESSKAVDAALKMISRQAEDALSKSNWGTPAPLPAKRPTPTAPAAVPSSASVAPRASTSMIPPTQVVSPAKPTVSDATGVPSETSCGFTVTAPPGPRCHLQAEPGQALAVPEPVHKDSEPVTSSASGRGCVTQ